MIRKEITIEGLSLFSALTAQQHTHRAIRTSMSLSAMSVHSLTPTPPPTTTSPPPPPPPKAPTPDGPLPRFLLDPGKFLTDLLHGVAETAADVGRALLPFVIAAIAMAIVAIVATWLRDCSQRGDAAFVEVAAPPEVDPAGAAALWQSLHRLLRPRLLLPYGRSHVAFELHMRPGQLRVGWWVPPGVNAFAVARAIEAAWPGTRAKRSSNPHLFWRTQRLCGAELRFGGPEWLPLATDHVRDPYRTLLGAAADMNGDECLIVQVLARPASAWRLGKLRRGLRRLQAGVPQGRLARFIAAWRTPTPRPPAPDPLRQADVRAAVGKLVGGIGFEVAVRYAVAGNGVDRDDLQRLRGRGDELAAAFGAYAGCNHLRRRRLYRVARAITTRPLHRGLFVSLDEMAALAHLPTDEAIAGWAQAGVRPVGPPLGVLDTDDLGRGRWNGDTGMSHG